MSTNPLNDFSRLHTALPRRSTERDQRSARRTTLKFLDSVKGDSFEWPARIAEIDDQVRFYLSQLIDMTILGVYNEAVRLIQKTTEHKANYKILRNAPKNCGGFKPKKAILEDATPFEQMVALDHVIDMQRDSWPVGRRTYAFYHNDEQVIPLYVSSRKNCKASVMTTILGAAKGQYKVPTYEELAASEKKATSSIFVQPLESLEYVRQPFFSGASVLKSSAFETDVVNCRHRYQVQYNDGTPYPFACVELKGQNSPQHARIRERSAGSNLLFLEKNAEERPLTRSLNFEDWSDEKYKDYADTTVKVEDYWNAVTQAVQTDEIDNLVNLTRNLFVSRVGPFTSEKVNNFYAEQLFQNEAG